MSKSDKRRAEELEAEDQRQQEFYVAFVEAWMEALHNQTGLAGVAKQMRLSKNNVINTSQKMRDLGVRLPSLRGTLVYSHNLRPDKLNAILAEKAKKTIQVKTGEGD